METQTKRNERAHEWLHEQAREMIRSFSPAAILDAIAEELILDADENGYVEDEIIQRDNAAIIAHASKHLKC